MAERCAHCGREGTLDHVQDVTIASRPTEVLVHSGADKRYIEEVEDQRVLNIRNCKVCAEPTLATYRWIDGWSDPGDDPIDWQLIYPPHRDLDALPARVRGRYAAMLELVHAPDVFAVRAGKLLEAICADKGILRKQGTRKNVPLHERLDQLVSGGAVPEALAKQAHLVKDYRNLGGHDDDVEVEERDVPLLREFAESLLDYLYWGPKKLEQGRVDLESRLAEAHVEDGDEEAS